MILNLKMCLILLNDFRMFAPDLILKFDFEILNDSLIKFLILKDQEAILNVAPD
jgi:hypothetical protein